MSVRGWLTSWLPPGVRKRPWLRRPLWITPSTPWGVVIPETVLVTAFIVPRALRASPRWRGTCFRDDKRMKPSANMLRACSAPAAAGVESLPVGERDWDLSGSLMQQFLSSFEVAASASGQGGVPDTTAPAGSLGVPGLPCVSLDEAHRHKNPISTYGLPACVARPVGKKEIEQEPAAQLAVQKEWDRLWKKHVWDASTVREWTDVAAKARDEKKEIHMGRLFGICVEKAAELPKSDPRRKYKYRVVFQGNNVITQNWEAALFQNLGSNPATMEAGKAADCVGCMDGNDCEQADAEQAYVQADLKGVETWVALA